MFKGILKGRRKAIVSATVATIVAGGAGAYAAIPDQYTGTYSGCYDSTSGAVRVVDNPSHYNQPTCAATEKPMTFNQQGPAGPTGMRGPKGDAGPANAHWAMFSGNPKLLAASEKVEYYAYGQYGYDYVHFPSVPDHSKCAVTATPAGTGSDYSKVFVSTYPMGSYWTLVIALDANGRFVPGTAINVVLNCSDTIYTP